MTFCAIRNKLINCSLSENLSNTVWSEKKKKNGNRHKGSWELATCCEGEKSICMGKGISKEIEKNIFSSFFIIFFGGGRGRGVWFYILCFKDVTDHIFQSRDWFIKMKTKGSVPFSFLFGRKTKLSWTSEVGNIFKVLTIREVKKISYQILFSQKSNMKK